jgi:hypothetical protein
MDAASTLDSVWIDATPLKSLMESTRPGNGIADTDCDARG